MTDLKKYLPEFVTGGPITTELFSCNEQALDQLIADRLDVFQQMFVETGTWGLTLWEAFLGLPTDNSKSLESRREAIIFAITVRHKEFPMGVLDDALDRLDFTVLGSSEDIAKYTIRKFVTQENLNIDTIKALGKELRRWFPAHLDCTVGTSPTGGEYRQETMGVGPVLVPRKETDPVYHILESDPQGVVSQIATYDAYPTTAYWRSRWNIASMFQNDYVFHEKGAAASLADRVFIQCKKKTPDKVRLNKRVIKGEKTTVTKLHTDAAPLNTITKRYKVGSRDSGTVINEIYIKKEVRCPMMHWQAHVTGTAPYWQKSTFDRIDVADYRNPLVCYINDTPQQTRDRIGPKKTREEQIEDYVTTTTYQFFDADNVPLSEKIAYKRLDVETHDSTPGNPPSNRDWTNKIYTTSGDGYDNYLATQNILLTNFPAGTCFVEVTHTIKRPDPTPRIFHVNEESNLNDSLWGGVNTYIYGPNKEFKCIKGSYYTWPVKPSGFVYPPGFSLSSEEAVFLRDENRNFWYIWHLNAYNNGGPNFSEQEVVNYADGLMANRFYETLSHQENTVTISEMDFVAYEEVEIDYPDSYLADIDLKYGRTRFYDLHELLGVPKVVRRYYDEEVNALKTTLHVSYLGEEGKAEREPRTCLNIIARTAGEWKQAGILEEPPDRLYIRRYDIKPTLRGPSTDGMAYNPYQCLIYHSGTTLSFAPILESGYQTLVPEDPRVAPYHSSNIIDFAGDPDVYSQTYPPSFVRRYTTWTSDTAGYIIRGKDKDDYYVSFDRKVRKYADLYYRSVNAGGYLGTCIRPPETMEYIKCPSIKIVNLTTLQVRDVDNPQLLELCRTAADFGPTAGKGPQNMNISESGMFGLVFPFVRVRTPYYPYPALDGSDHVSWYNVGEKDTGGLSPRPVVNGMKYSMYVVDPNTFLTNFGYEYVYNNNGMGDEYQFDLYDRFPLCPTDITPSMTMWMETSYDISRASAGGFPLLQPPKPADKTLVTLGYLYPTSHIASFTYPYIPQPLRGIESLATGLRTVTGAEFLYPPSSIYYGSNHSNCDWVKRAIDSSRIYTNHNRNGRMFISMDNRPVKLYRTSVNGTPNYLAPHFDGGLACQLWCDGPHLEQFPDHIRYMDQQCVTITRVPHAEYSIFDPFFFA